MRPRDYTRWLAGALLAQKKRSLLSATGFAIGIAMVVLMLALGEGLRAYVLGQFTQFGTHLLAITPGKEETQGMGGVLKTFRPLTLDDTQALSRLPVVDKIVPAVWGTARISVVTAEGGRARSTDVAGSGHDALDVFKLEMAIGQFLPPDPLESPRSLAVLGSELREHLFGRQNPLGESIRIGSRRFRIIGVLAPKGQFLGYNMDDVVYIPAQRALQLFNRDSLMEIDVLYPAWYSSVFVANQLTRVLALRHGAEDFTVITQDQMLSSLDQILWVLKLAAGGLGAISLLVSAVGVFTIQTLTCNERRGEIGLLRALGCSKILLVMLFLGEASLLAALGGMIGAVSVMGLLWAASWLLPALPLELSVATLIGAVAFAALIGALAGVRPAINAAKLDPVAALREL